MDDTKTYDLLILCYHREARGYAARAIRRAGIARGQVEYRSRAALIFDGCPRADATPRYLLDRVTEADAARIERELALQDAYGVEMY